MRLQAQYCPACGAPVDVPEGVARVTCAYCNTTLVVEASSVSTRRPPPPPAPKDEEQPYPEPDATLTNWVMPRFELSLVEQDIPEAVKGIFAGFELGEQRFAFVSLRVVDKDGAPVKHELAPAYAALKASLESDGDPGLSVNLALETLCKGPFTHRLEVALALFEPRHMRVTPYAAGSADAIVWASSEEGRCVTVAPRRSALERKSLREAQDHFENGRPIHLAAQDVVLFASPGYLGHGGKGYGNGLRELLDTVNEHLGEEPLRVVTLAKNAFWADFQKNLHSRPVPVGDVKVVAVRAVLPPETAALPTGSEVKVLRSRRYEVAALVHPGEQLRLLPLHADRQVVVWLSARQGALPADAMDKACTAVTALLDRRDYGDNENPRRAGREALEALGLPEGTVDLAVIQLFDQYHRVKYFRAGWKQAIALGSRGVKSDGMQQFDEGGEATVNEDCRLFFPGALDYEGQFDKAEPFAEVWLGGKASRLYEAYCVHWKTKKTAAALERLVRAALSDAPGSRPHGFALVTGLAGS